MTRRTPWLLLALLVPPVQAADAPAITVHLYDLANAPENVLTQAMDITTRLYADVGVPLKWVRQPAPVAKPGQAEPYRPSSTPSEVSVRLLPKHLSDLLIRPGSIQLGIAYPVGQNTYRYLATLLYDRVELAATSLSDIPLPVLLGHLMAHELGHLLLGPEAHARSTIMMCPWDTSEFRQLRSGRLRFNSKQAAQLRSNVATRMEAADSKRAASGRP